MTRTKEGSRGDLMFDPRQSPFLEPIRCAPYRTQKERRRREEHDKEARQVPEVHAIEKECTGNCVGQPSIFLRKKKS